MLVHLKELLRIADLLSEKHKSGQLADHVCANGHHIQLGVIVKSRVVHGEVNHLLIVNYGCKVSPGQIWLIVF